MEILEQRHGAVMVVRPQGPLLEAEVNAFRRRVTDVIQKSLGRFVLDASQIAYADSKGLEALLDISEELNEGGQSLRLCCANETLREVLDLTDISPLVEHYDDVGTAVRSFL